MFTDMHVRDHSDQRQFSDLQDADNFLFFVEALAGDKTDTRWLTHPAASNLPVRPNAPFDCSSANRQRFGSCNENDTDSSSSAEPYTPMSGGQGFNVGCSSPDDFADNGGSLPGPYTAHCYEVKLGKSDRRYTCTTCHKEFKRRSSLSTHKLIHANIKPFQCPTCKKEFLRRSDLKKHVLMHTGQKPHRCTECGKEFSQSSNMLTHMRRHSGVRPFACQICGHAFFRKVDVRRHQYRHLREKSLSSTSSLD